jgi:DNA-binding transcriptional LysR family regulator
MNTKFDLNLLLAFEALLAEGNVTRAARRLNLSQPALSSQLVRLRALFGDQLFIPTSRGVLPTERALGLREPLYAALEATRALVDATRHFEPAIAENTFSLAATDYVQIAVLLPFILELRSIAPRLRLMIRLGDSRTTLADLTNGSVHLAFIQPENIDGSLRGVDLFREQYVGIEHKRAGRSKRSMLLDEFLTRDHVIVSPRAEGFRGPTDEALKDIGATRRVGLAVSSFVFLIEAVARSSMIAMAPARLAAQHRDRISTFVAPVAVPDFTIAMAWHDRCHSHPAHSWLRERMVAFCSCAKTP